MTTRKLTAFIFAFLLILQTIIGVFAPVNISVTPPYIFSQETKAAGESWYDASWIKRKAITVTENSGSTLTNYQVKITVPYDSDMQADFDDIRFTNENGSTLIDHWLESKTDSTTADFWVEIPSLTASSDRTIYAYYGNGLATSASNGDNTFVFFDDFESGNLDKWEVKTGANITSVSANVYKGNYAVEAFGAVNSFYKLNSYGNSFILEGMIKPGNNVYGWFGTIVGTSWNSDSRLFGHFSDNINIQVYDGTFRQFSQTFNSYSKLKIVISNTNVEYYINGVLVYTGTYATTVDKIVLYNYSGSDNVFGDDIYVRKYASSDPTIGVLGGEEYLDHLTITGSSTQTAGTPQIITITAKTNLGTTYTGYTGDKSITFSGANDSPNSTTPTCSDKNSADIDLGTATTLTFTNGIATCDLKLYKTESAEIEGTDGTYTTTGDANDLNITVSSTTLNNFTISSPSSGTSGTAFSATITSRDAYNNTTTTVSGDTTVSVNQSGSITPSAVVDTEFTDDGIYTGNLTITNIEEQPVITIITTNGLSTGADTITVLGTPTAPTGAMLSEITTTSMKLTWTDNSSLETEYKIEKSTDNITYTQIGTVSSDATEYIGSGTTFLDSYITYYFRVRAYNTVGNSSYSTTNNTTLSAGGGLPPSAYALPAQPESTPENPEGGFSVLINNNDEYTDNETVILKFYAGADTKRMAISNTEDFAGASQIAYQEEINWELSGCHCEPQRSNPATTREESNVGIAASLCGAPRNDSICVVYVKFYTQYGVASEVVSDSIILKTITTETEEQTEDSDQEETVNPESSNNPESDEEIPTEDNKLSLITFTETLQFGSRGTEVANLQNKLKELNFFPEEIESNGNFGPVTKQAVIEYQKSKGIYPCGIVGPRTRKALNNEGFITNKDYQFTQDLKYNDKNEDVKQLQTRLRDQNFFPYNVSSTGWFGSITQKAVNIFQKFYNLIQSGIVDEGMRKVLNR